MNRPGAGPGSRLGELGLEEGGEAGREEEAECDAIMNMDVALSPRELEARAACVVKSVKLVKVVKL